MLKYCVLVCSKVLVLLVLKLVLKLELGFEEL